MISDSERAISERLRAILARLPVAADLPQDDSLQQALRPLEGFVPRILCEIHHEWERESLDGIYPYVARKIGEREAEIFGICVLISDQTVVPLHLRFQIAHSSDEIRWMECRLGSRGPHGMIRTPYKSFMSPLKEALRLYGAHGCWDKLEWMYQVAFGERGN